TVTMEKLPESATRHAVPSSAEISSPFSRPTATGSIGAVGEPQPVSGSQADAWPRRTTSEPPAPGAPRGRRALVLAAVAVAVLAVTAFMALPLIIVPTSEPGVQPTLPAQVTSVPQPAAFVPPTAS